MIGADILVMGGLFSDRGQFIFYGKTARTLITGNGYGVKHVAISTLHSLQHIDYAIPPSADAGWLGEIGLDPNYLDPGSGGPENDFMNRNTTFRTWNLMHTARRLIDGEPYVTPILSEGNLLDVNKALVAQCGADREAIPRDWAGLVEVLEQCKAAGVVPMNLGMLVWLRRILVHAECHRAAVDRG